MTWVEAVTVSEARPSRKCSGSSATSGLTSILGQGTNVNRVSGQPLYLVNDINGNWDPTNTFVLNPAAWANPAPGKFGTAAAYYDDYRYQRRPNESMSLARNFRFGEGRYNIMIRAEFQNIFNRAYRADPSNTNAFSTQQRNSSGSATGGFGWINTATVQSPPRQGTIVARFTF